MSNPNKMELIYNSLLKNLCDSLNSQDLKIHGKRSKLEFATCRKPTQTYTIILSDLCHPYGHKIARNNYLINRVHSYPITEEAKTKEPNIIHDILYYNEYNKNVSIRHSK
jgi:hypothetical protein